MRSGVPIGVSAYSRSTSGFLRARRPHPHAGAETPLTALVQRDAQGAAAHDQPGVDERERAERRAAHRGHVVGPLREPEPDPAPAPRILPLGEQHVHLGEPVLGQQAQPATGPARFDGRAYAFARTAALAQRVNAISSDIRTDPAGAVPGEAVSASAAGARVLGVNP
jgi:hypothetical protein